MKLCVCLCVVMLFFGYADAIFPVPMDIPMSLIAVYGFTPPIHLGRDHRVGFGFRLGNHADFQVMYEFGPQIRTRPLQPIKVRSAAYRVQRRRPLVELLLRAGLLEEAVYDDGEAAIDEPR